MELTELEDKIKKAANDYYNGNESMSDEEYDQLIEELRFLDPENPLIAGLAGEEDGDKIPHKLITGTLAKCKDEYAFRDWHRKQPKAKYSVELKIDGSGQELQYEDGKLKTVVSRGNGFKGTDHTEIFQFIDCPKELKTPFNGSIRIETVLKTSEFINPIFRDMKNPRNATAGILNRKVEELSEEDKIALSYVSVIAYDLLDDDGELDNTQTDKLNFLTENGFEIPEHFISDDVDEILEWRKQKAIQRPSLEYGIDGIVIKPVECDKEDLKLRCPKKSCAIKFDLSAIVTKLIGIEWHTSGNFLTPIALLEPVDIDGTTVQRASLTNLEQIRKMNLEIGCLVKLVKRGEIIPHIEGRAD